MDSTPVTAKDERDDGLTSTVAKVTKWREPNLYFPHLIKVETKHESQFIRCHRRNIIKFMQYILYVGKYPIFF